MRRRHRLALTALVLACGVGAAFLLLSLGSRSEGPIGAVLTRAAATVDTVEHRVREAAAGPGRRRHLAWFAGFRDGGRLRRPADVLLGAFDSGLPGSIAGVVHLERTLETTFPLVQVYSAWGDARDQVFPLRIATTIWNMGSVPVITWEPWLSAFDNVRHPFLPLREARDHHGLGAVARGDYDFYIDQWAAAAARFGRPLLVRFAHEMNDPYRYPWGPQNNTKEEFIDAWRRVVERFRQAGATNVLWAWSPHVAYEYWDLYYPGDEYVDWVAVGVLNFGPIAHWSRWWTFDEIFGTKYPRLAGFGKPIVIAEFGSLGFGGNRADWYREALTDLPVRYPAVRSILFFHARDDQTVTYQKVDWGIAHDPKLAAAVASAIRSWRRQ